MTREASDAIPIGGALPEGCEISSPTQNSYVNVNSIDHLTKNGSCHESLSSGNPSKPLPVDLLPGEVEEDSAEFEGCCLILTNYRLCILSTNNTVAVVPRMNFDTLDLRDQTGINLTCKDGKFFKLTALTYEQAINWHRQLLKCCTRQSIKDAFAWSFARALRDNPSWLKDYGKSDCCELDFKRLRFDPDHFRIYNNEQFLTCDTYPHKFIVPRALDDAEVKLARDHRFNDRMIAVTWKCESSRAILMRSAQPRAGLLNWRSTNDEKIVVSVNNYMRSYSETKEVEPSVIYDCRSYGAAFANKAKGGGYEYGDYYEKADIRFMGLPNIHSVRNAFCSLRTAVLNPNDANYLANVQGSSWLQYVKSLIQFSVECAELLQSGVSVLIHCSDGWDRTTQVVSLIKLFMDDYYRTIEGFQTLIQRDWVEFGHKFADRNGVFGGDVNEKSPIFMQWLDAVRHVYLQNPDKFEFNMNFLLKLGQHSYSGLFGTFLFNSSKEYEQTVEEEKVEPISIWSYLGRHNEAVINGFYKKPKQGEKSNLNLEFGMYNMTVWRELYYVEPVDPNALIPTLLSSPARSETSPRENGSTLVKSKSSESINSLDPTGVSLNHSFVGGESNSILNNSDPLIDSTYSESSFHRQNPRHRSSFRDKPPQSAKELLEEDGLVRFHDPLQERLKEKEEALQKRLSEEQAKNRHRSVSERTNSSIVSRDSIGHMNSVGEESDDMRRALSDMSIVDSNEAPRIQPNNFDLSTSCYRCKKSLWKYTGKVIAETAIHHCRSCGRTVCGECSPHQFHSEQMGGGVLLRSCTPCYNSFQCGSTDKTKVLDDISNNESSRNSDNNSLLSNSQTTLYMTSQAVKG